MAEQQAQTDDNQNGEQLNFSADVARLLDIVANALYSNRDVFLRELISNAADACDRLRYESLQHPGLISGDSDFRIQLYKDAEPRHLKIIDNGIGMDRQELVDNLGTIAKSGTQALMEQMAQAQDSEEKLSLIGQFGVGFYATFMVAEKVSVISRKAGEETTWFWESDGRTGFEVREATNEEANELLSDRGTAIIATIKPDCSDFLMDEKISEVVRTYSDHIGFPIYLGEPEEGEDKQPVNAANALWMRPKSEITQDQYNEFYRHISGGMALDEPLVTAHWHAEGKIAYTALIFVPSMRPFDLYDPSRKTSVRLYVKRVFITDNCEGLIPPWLRFVRGIVDSEDLPLNISREMLQHNLVIQKIRNGIAKRVLGDLQKLAEDDEAAFTTFWQQFGPVVKEGLYDAVEHREDLFKICRFHSTHNDGELISLADYKTRMKDNQDTIYYISGENLDTLKNSPQLEGFRARGLEVLLMVDTIDDFWLNATDEYDGCKFVSITKGDVDLSRYDDEGKDRDQDSESSEDETQEKETSDIQPLIDRFKAILGEEVGDIRKSARLTDSPVCLIADEKGVDMHMERVLRIHQQYEPQTRHILELNPEHALIRQLNDKAAQGTDSETLDEAAHLLLDQARIVQGESVPDPTRFARSMSRFLAKSVE